MHRLTQLILSDMKPALGVTEPAAIAFATATAREHAQGEIQKIVIRLNSGMYKNAFTCGIPGMAGTGILRSAALGAIAGRPEKGLEVLCGITDAERAAAEALAESGRITADMAMVSSDIYIEATVESRDGRCTVIVRHTHTHISRIVVNGETVFRADEAEQEAGAQAAAQPQSDAALPGGLTLAEMLAYIEGVDAAELYPLAEAYRMNLALFQAALKSPQTRFARKLLALNSGKVISEDARRSAQLLCNAAIEGRVIGLDLPAMSITGSGAHGIICTMPLYALQKTMQVDQDRLLRATALSYLVTMFIKNYSGRLSAFCGCGIAAGTGMACAAAWMRGANQAQVEMVIRNMAAGITGMICDGGNQGCTMKGIVAVDAAWNAVDFALNGIAIDGEHGICAATPEDTMRQMGRIASPGMEQTESVIVDIMRSKHGC